MSAITVYKNNHAGEPILHYSGQLVERGTTWVCIDASFGRDDVDVGYVVFRRGDRMTEWFFSDRWYNIFRIEDVRTKQLKGWYCNITRPAHLTDTTITADDLALDVFVTPGGAIVLDDEDEFAALRLPTAERAAALTAVAELRQMVASRAAPFDEITPG